MKGQGKGEIEMPDNILYWIWLSELFAKGSDTPNQLLDRLGTPERIFKASVEELAALGILNAAELTRLNRHSLERAEFILKECERLKIQIAIQSDSLYPDRLRHIYGAPIVLYYYGDFSGLNDIVTLGVVGTRRPSDYGKRITDELCHQLAGAGAAIISGCAVGIDAHAHMGALKAGGKTVAVLGCGLDVDYPAENNGLKREILLHGGALITELPPGSSVSGKYFPTRNRLISGLSLGVVVTEAPLRSGATITLNLALDQGKDVFCVPPHDIHDNMFCGVVKPLREGAIPVYGAEDILDEYRSEYSHKLSAEIATADYMRHTSEEMAKRQAASRVVQKQKTDTSQNQPELDGIQKKVYNMLSHEPQYVNELAEASGLSLPEILSALTELEIEGLAVSYSGQRYGRI